MNNFQKVLRNTAYLTISEIFLKILGFVWIIFLARSLSVELFGRYNLVNSFITIFSFLPDLGIGMIVIREIAKKREKAPNLIGNSLILNGLLALITILIVFLSITFLNFSSSIRILVGISAFTLFISTLRSVGIFYFDGMEKMKYSAILNSLNSIFLIGSAFLGFVLGYQLQGIFVGMFMGTLVSLFITWSFVKKFITPKLSFDSSMIKHLFIEGLPLGIASFAALVYSRIDSLILAKFLGEYSVGIYSSATPLIFALIQLLNVPFVVSVYPALTRLSIEDRSRFLLAFRKSFYVIILWSLPVSIFISVFAQIVPLIFGQRYQEAVPILRILIFYVPFACLSALLYKGLIIIHKQSYYLFISIIGALISIVLNMILIPQFGIIGAAIAAVTTQVILFVLYISSFTFLLHHR